MGYILVFLGGVFVAHATETGSRPLAFAGIACCIFGGFWNGVNH